MTQTQILLRTNLLVLLLASVASAQLPGGFFTDVALVPGVNSPSQEWGNVAISPDNMTLYFASERPGGEGDKDLYQATRVSVNDDWGNLMNLGTGINTSSYEANPYITEDGTTLYFTSDRAGGEGGFDIWFATRESTTEEFGDVQNLGPAINSQFNDGGTTFPSGELSIYYSVQNRDGGFGGFDLYTATRSSDTEPFEPSENLGLGVNTDVDEFNPFVTLDESLLLFSDYFSPYRPGGEGGADIWVATRNGGGTFGNVENIGATVNTPANEAFAVLSPDWPNVGSTLYFGSDQPGSLGRFDIWQATWVPEPTQPGDFDGNGIVDGHDFLEWQRDPSVGSLADWETNYGVPLSATSAAVPKPTTSALAALCLAMSRRRST